MFPKMIKISRIYTRENPKTSKKIPPFFFPQKKDKENENPWNLQVTTTCLVTWRISNEQKTNVWSWYRSHQTFILIIIFFIFLPSSSSSLPQSSSSSPPSSFVFVLSLACACCSPTFLHSLCYLFSVISFSVVNQRFVTALLFLIFFFLPESLSRILDGIVLFCVFDSL